MPTDSPSGEPSPPQGSWPARRIAVAALAALLVGGFIALLVVGLTARGVDTSIDSAIAKGQLKAAPEFTLPVLAYGNAVGKQDGETLSLSELRGRPVVLNFWASWCDPCKREAPILEGAWRAGRSQSAVVLGLDIQDLSENAKAFIEKYGQTYPQVRDKTDDTYRAYGLTGVPETFFIDRQGRVRVHWIGEINAEQVADGLKIILAPTAR